MTAPAFDHIYRLRKSGDKVNDLVKQIDKIIDQDNIKIDFLWEVYYSILRCVGSIKYDMDILYRMKKAAWVHDIVNKEKKSYSESLDNALNAARKLIESKHGEILKKRVETYVDKIVSSSCPTDQYKAKVWKNQIKNLDNIKNYRAV